MFSKAIKREIKWTKVVRCERDCGRGCWSLLRPVGSSLAETPSGASAPTSVPRPNVRKPWLESSLASLEQENNWDFDNILNQNLWFWLIQSRSQNPCFHFYLLVEKVSSSPSPKTHLAVCQLCFASLKKLLQRHSEWLGGSSHRCCKHGAPFLNTISPSVAAELLSEFNRKWAQSKGHEIVQEKLANPRKGTWRELGVGYGAWRSLGVGDHHTR